MTLHGMPASALAALFLGCAAGSGSLQGKTAPPGRDQARAASAPMFSWFADLVAFDRASRQVTVKATVEPHVLRYIERFRPGDPIVIVWQQFEGEGDAVKYIAASDRVAADAGFIVRGAFVGADVAGRSMTFTTAVADGLIKTLASARAGTSIRFRSSQLPENGRPATTALALDEVPKPRPAPKPRPSEADEASRSANVAGKWTLETRVMNNALKLTCDFTQEGKKLGGKCGGPGPLGEVEISGGVDGTAVTFQFEVTSFGPRLVFLHRGELGADGAIKGTLNMMGADSAFTMTKVLY
jgi:hypothetical protein